MNAEVIDIQRLRPTKNERAAAITALNEAEELFGERPFPMPVAVNAEREVVSALLDGLVKVDDLSPLRGSHFFGSIHRAVYELAESGVDVTSLDNVVNALQTDGGFVGDLEAMLEVERDTVAWRGTRQCKEAAGRILEMARRRWLLERLDQLTIGLRSGGTTATEAIGILRDVVTPTRQASVRK